LNLIWPSCKELSESCLGCLTIEVAGIRNTANRGGNGHALMTHLK
jgi:hypothetical protein